MGFGEDVKLPSKSIHKNNTISIVLQSDRQTGLIQFKLLPILQDIFELRVRVSKGPVKKFVTKDN